MSDCLASVLQFIKTSEEDEGVHKLLLNNRLSTNIVTQSGDWYDKKSVTKRQQMK